jgi:hypothetical protein
MFAQILLRDKVLSWVILARPSIAIDPCPSSTSVNWWWWHGDPPQSHGTPCMAGVGYRANEGSHWAALTCYHVHCTESALILPVPVPSPNPRWPSHTTSALFGAESSMATCFPSSLRLPTPKRYISIPKSDLNGLGKALWSGRILMGFMSVRVLISQILDCAPSLVGYSRN